MKLGEERGAIYIAKYLPKADIWSHVNGQVASGTKKVHTCSRLL